MADEVYPLLRPKRHWSGQIRPGFLGFLQKARDFRLCDGMSGELDLCYADDLG
ncbi:MAG: hypothetical protein ABI191_09115 [Rhizomicrobium sp.]